MLLTHVGIEKFGTTKVQLGADSAEGAVSAELQDCSFPKGNQNPSKNGKNNVLR